MFFWNLLSRAGSSIAEAEAELQAREAAKQRQRARAGPSRGRSRVVAKPQMRSPSPSGRELFASTGALALAKIALKGRKLVNDVLGRTALQRARRRVVIARKLAAVAEARAQYRAEHVCYFRIASVLLIFALLLRWSCPCESFVLL